MNGEDQNGVFSGAAGEGLLGEASVDIAGALQGMDLSALDIQWAGRPSSRPRFLDTHKIVALFSSTLVVLLVFDAPELAKGNVAPLIIFGLPLYLFVVIAGPIRDISRRKRLVYVLTNTRALAVDKRGPKILWSVNYVNTFEIHVLERKGGQGTIHFGPLPGISPWMDPATRGIYVTGPVSKRPCFELLDNVDEVYALIRRKKGESFEREIGRHMNGRV